MWIASPEVVVTRPCIFAFSSARDVVLKGLSAR